MTDEAPKEKKLRGFAWLRANRPERLREICSDAGRKAHATGRAHEFTRDEASDAGRHGGKAVLDRHGVEHFERIGKAGGQAKGRAYAERRAARLAQAVDARLADL